MRFWEDGRPVLLHLDLGPRESYYAWLSFLQDMVARGLQDPLLVIFDGAAGLHKAVKRMWPRAFHQRCQVHKMRNILAKLPRVMQGQMKRLIQQVFLASSHAQALKRGRALIAQFRDRYLALLFASLMTASKRWRGVKMTPAVIKQLQLLRGETVMTASQKVLRNVEMRIFNASRFYRKIGT